MICWGSEGRSALVGGGRRFRWVDDRRPIERPTVFPAAIGPRPTYSARRHDERSSDAKVACGQPSNLRASICPFVAIVGRSAACRMIDDLRGAFPSLSITAFSPNLAIGRDGLGRVRDPSVCTRDFRDPGPFGQCGADRFSGHWWTPGARGRRWTSLTIPPRRRPQGILRRRSRRHAVIDIWKWAVILDPGLFRIDADLDVVVERPRLTATSGFHIVHHGKGRRKSCTAALPSKRRPVLRRGGWRARVTGAQPRPTKTTTTGGICRDRGLGNAKGRNGHAIGSRWRRRTSCS